MAGVNRSQTIIATLPDEGRAREYHVQCLSTMDIVFCTTLQTGHHYGYIVNNLDNLCCTRTPRVGLLANYVCSHRQLTSKAVEGQFTTKAVEGQFTRKVQLLLVKDSLLVKYSSY